MSQSDNIAVMIGNLPSDVTEDDLHDALEGMGYELDISLTGKDPKEDVLAIVRFDGMSRVLAEKFAQQVNGMSWRGRTLTAYVPLFFK